MYNHKRILLFSLGLVTILLAACASLPGNSQPGRGVTVRVARATWDTGWFQPQVFSLLLEELGYTVTDAETASQ